MSYVSSMRKCWGGEVLPDDESPGIRERRVTTRRACANEAIYRGEFLLSVRGVLEVVGYMSVIVNRDLFPNLDATERPDCDSRPVHRPIEVFVPHDIKGPSQVYCSIRPTGVVDLLVLRKTDQ